MYCIIGRNESTRGMDIFLDLVLQYMLSTLLEGTRRAEMARPQTFVLDAHSVKTGAGVPRESLERIKPTLSGPLPLVGKVPFSF
jgi:hypothetical protein